MKRKKAALEVQKFGGTDELGKVRVHDSEHEASSIEARSKTTLEDESIGGHAAVIRCFTFGINPLAFKDHQPTRQELFNMHIRGIEIMLWRDGLTLMHDVEPRLTLDEKAMQYKIFVGAKPAMGHVLLEKPQTLREIVHGNHGN